MKKIIPKLNHQNVRNAEQAKRMKLADENKLCPFCGEGLKVIHKNPILKKTKNFLFTQSAFPYEGTSHHFLILAKKHITDPQKITGKMWAEIGDLMKYALRKYKILGGSLFFRFGEMHATGSSIDHVHFHVLSGNATEFDDEKTREPIRVKLGYRKI